MTVYKIHFPETSFASIELPEEAQLSDYLTACNSPVLFGCRSGICGTCVVEMEALEGCLSNPNDLEQETLSLYAPDQPSARLACQYVLTGSINIKKSKKSC